MHEFDSDGAGTLASPAAPLFPAAGREPGAPSRRHPGLGRTLAICTASQMLATASVLSLAGIAPLVASSLSIEPSWIGYQVSLIYFAGIFASAVAGSLVKRWGAARLNAVALVCAGGGMAGLASGLLWLMLASSLLLGIGYAFNNPCSSHMLNRVTPARLRNAIFSVKQAGVPAGGMLAAVSLPHLASALGWQGAVLAGALPSLALALLFFVLREWWDDDRKPATAVDLKTVWRGQSIVWRHRGLVVLSLLGLFYSAIQLCVSAFVVTMLVEELGWTPVSAAGMAAAVQLCGAGGRILWGIVADLLDAGFLVLSFLGAATASCCVALALGPSMPVGAEIAFLCVTGLCSVGWNGVMLAETARLSPSSAAGGSGTLTGDVLVYTFAGVVLGPSTFALVYSWLGSYVHAFALLGIPALLGTGLAGWAHRHRHGLVQAQRE